MKKQCELLSLSRSSYYYEPARESELNLTLMKLIDGVYTEWPFYGSRKITGELVKKGYQINRKRTQRLMQKMGLRVVYPRPNLSKPNEAHKTYPYLLRGLIIEGVNHVWSTDITYVPVRKGYLYLVAILDWFSRYVLTWKLSNSLESNFCIEVLEEALEKGKPKIFNSDQGCQFTSNRFVGILESHAIQISMDGKGRAFDNIFVERLWRTVKYEEVYCKAYESFEEAQRNLKDYFKFYNEKRIHQSLGYKTPGEIYRKQ
jgi:putative transposase